MGKVSVKKHSSKTKKQLVQELEALYRRVTSNDRSNGKSSHIKEMPQQRKRVKTAAIEEMPDGVIFVNMDGKVIYVNKAVEKLLGFKADELIGKEVLDLPTYRSPRDVKKAGDAFKELLEKGITEHIDIGAVNKEGKEIAISFAASVIRDAHDNPKTLVAVLRDITKRKLAEDALKEREENFRALIDNSMDVSLITNADLTVRYVSPSVQRTLGYKPDEIIGKSALEFLSPDDVQYITDHFDDFTQNPGQPVALEVRFRHHDGSWKVIDSITNNMVNEPTVMGFVVNARDITERKQAEDILKEREEHFRALIENSLDGIAILDADLRITYESPSAEKIVGYSLEELIGKNTLDFIHPDDKESVIKRFKRLYRQPAQDTPGTIRFRHKNGEWHTMEATANNLLDNPAVKGIVINYRDVTERQRAEEALRQREEHFRVMIENSLDDVAILDASGNIMYQSPSIERGLGFPEGRLNFGSYKNLS